VTSVNFPFLIIEMCQEYHLQEVIGQKKICQFSEREFFTLSRRFVTKNNIIIDGNETNVDSEQNCDECEPIKILSKIVDEICLVTLGFTSINISAS